MIEIGKKFGRWTVAGDSFMRDPGHRAVPCLCSCGTQRDVLAFALLNGQSTSCGCAKREQVATLVSRTRWKGSHGYAAAGSRHPLYTTYQKIKARCYNPKSVSYPWYGARGVGMHEAWRDDAGAFVDWIMANLGPRPDAHTLDRIDPERDYEPGNLRWATHSEQRRNRRTTAANPATKRE